MIHGIVALLALALCASLFCSARMDWDQYRRTAWICLVAGLACGGVGLVQGMQAIP